MKEGDRVEVVGGPGVHPSWEGKRGTLVAVEADSFGHRWVICDMGPDYGHIEFMLACVRRVIDTRSG